MLATPVAIQAPRPAAISCCLAAASCSTYVFLGVTVSVNEYNCSETTQVLRNPYIDIWAFLKSFRDAEFPWITRLILRADHVVPLDIPDERLGYSVASETSKPTSQASAPLLSRISLGTKNMERRTAKKPA